MRSFSLALPIKRSQVHLTSAAVNGLPSCHLTPCRNGKVSSVPSSLHDQLLARSGTTVSRLDLAMCWSYMTRLLNTPIIGCNAARVDSSRIDMLAGLSKWASLTTPPYFSAKAGAPAIIAVTSSPTPTTHFNFIAIFSAPVAAAICRAKRLHASAFVDAVDHDRQALYLGRQLIPSRLQKMIGRDDPLVTSESQRPSGSGLPSARSAPQIHGLSFLPYRIYLSSHMSSRRLPLKML